MLYDHLIVYSRPQPKPEDIDIPTIDISTSPWAALLTEIIRCLRKESRQSRPSPTLALCQAALVVAEVRLDGWVSALLYAVLQGWSSNGEVTESSVSIALHDHRAFAKLLTDIDAPECAFGMKTYLLGVDESAVRSEKRLDKPSEERSQQVSDGRPQELPEKRLERLSQDFSEKQLNKLPEQRPQE